MTIEAEGKRINAKADAALKDMALAIQREAKRLIQSHASKGKKYKATKGGKYHYASKPGKPPNTDTGVLVKSIRIAVHNKGYRVGTNLDYGRKLELGVGIAKRPWLSLALKNVEKRLPRIVRGAFKVGSK